MVLVLFRARLMAGHRVLAPAIEVRILGPEVTYAVVVQKAD